MQAIDTQCYTELRQNRRNFLAVSILPPPPPYYSLNFYKLHHLLTFLPHNQSFVCGRFAYPCLGQKWRLRPLNNLLKFLILNLLQLGQYSDKISLSKYGIFANEKTAREEY